MSHTRPGETGTEDLEIVMNEVENHYGSVGDTHSAPGATSSKPADVAKAAIDSAVSAAKSTLKGAAETARGTAEDVRRAAETHYGRAASAASEGYDTVSRNATYARRRSALHVDRTRRNVEGFVGENPIMVGVAGLAAGLLIGTLIPGTRRENQVFGRYADEVRDQGLRYARDLTEQGRHFVEEALDTRGAADGDRRS